MPLCSRNGPAAPGPDGGSVPVDGHDAEHPQRNGEERAGSPEPADVGSRTAKLALAHLHLDDLLLELQDRARDIQSTADRLRVLLETVLAIGSELALPTLLRRIVEGACDLVDA